MQISQFVLEGTMVEVTLHKKKLAFTFEHDGKQYGNAVMIPSSKGKDIVDATFLLITNALDTLKALKHDH